MKKRNSKHEKRIKKLIISCALCAIILAISTYAWFIGMKTVNVSKFDISIQSTEGLFLSLDGENWSYNLEDVTQATAYTGNTNVFANTEDNNGLVPMSSVGDIDATSSRMKLFQKGSLTAAPAGMRLLASQVDNSGAAEGNGYVAFDLFIRNLSGKAYYPDDDILNEEAIYLTTKSAVSVVSTGADGQDKTGIENSIRVGFAQIGRVEDGAAKDVITGLTCTSDDAKKTTGICRSAKIWEPNDTKHVQNAINWYNTSCGKRLAAGTDVNDKASYDSTDRTCGTVVEGTESPTYAISRRIDIADQVNIYDGAEFNGYEANTKTYAEYEAADETAKSAMKLIEYPYFKDSDKVKTGMDRPQFMSLAPNSITKVRVYIWLEGQDIDNYDFASLGKQVAINFGFTKERFKEGDVNYEGPSTGVDDEHTPDTPATGD